MDPLNEDELSEVMQQWTPSPVPATLEARIFGTERKQARASWWKRRISYSIRISVPALLVTVLFILVLGVFAFRFSRNLATLARRPDTQIPAGLQTRGQPTVSNSTPNSHPDALRLDDHTLAVSPAAADRNLMNSAQPLKPLVGSSGLQGTVRLEVRIGSDGIVTDAKVIRGNAALAQAAIEAAKQRVYRPTLLNGNPMAVVSQVDVTFTLDVTLISSVMQ